jgi:two-component system response regulator HydG
MTHRDRSTEALPALTPQVFAETPSLAPMTERLSLAAASDLPVLLTGETGTGKTHLARLLHHYSPRRCRRLLTVPCGALAPPLLLSEFFGHLKGAFTGADHHKIGKFEAAADGTLLLDEIDTLPLEAQAALLRVIETGEFEPVGSNTTCRAQARVVAASNWELEAAVARGDFRQDLYYRLNVFAFSLPPLRQRPEDIVGLAQSMVGHFARQFGKNPPPTLAAETLGVLQAFPWPGNIRQLENVLLQAVLVCPGSALLVEHLPVAVREYAGQVPMPPRDAPWKPGVAREAEGGQRTLSESLREGERELIAKALIEAGFSRRRAASALGISRVTLYKKMKKYGLMTLTEGSRFSNSA